MGSWTSRTFGRQSAGQAGVRPRSREASTRLLGSIDEPGEGYSPSRGVVTVRGWAAHRHREVTGVVVTVNGHVAGAAEVFGPRPDVAAVHGDVPGAATSGWSTQVDLSRVQGAEVVVDAFAVMPRSQTSEPASDDTGPAGLGAVRRFASRTMRLAGGAGAEVRSGCFVQRDELDSGPQRIYGLAEAPGGVSRVEVFCDGVSVGFARTSLPGRFEGADQGPESALALFERVVDLPSGRDEVEFTATVTPCVGTSFDIRPWTATVRPEVAEKFSEQRLQTVRERTERAVLQIADARRDAGSDGPVRVLVVTHDLGLGGGQLYLQELLVRLAGPEFQLHVVSPRGGPLLDELEELGVEVLVTGTFDAHDPESYEAQIRQIACWAAERGCEVALANTMSAFPGVDAAQRLGLEVVWAIHESFPVRQFCSEAFLPPTPTYVAERAVRALEGTHRAVFEARATLDLYAPHLPADSAEVVPYGVDFDAIDAYRVSIDRAELRRGLGFDDDTLVVLCLGTVEPRKAQINIAQAFAATRASSAGDARLVFVGAKEGSPYVEALEDYLVQSGEERVRLEPVQPDTYQWYYAADVLVSGSDVESLPRSMLEAMAFECPIAATDVFGVPDLVTDSVDGFLCRSRDLNALRDMLERVVETPRADIERMGRQARANVLSAHDPAIYTSYFRELLLGLATERRAARV